jgi:hypothetical protein
MAIRISLDNTLLADTPRGWDDAKIKSKRGSEFKGLFLTYSNDLEFYGDGFDYIDAKLNDSYCNIIEVLIETNDCDPNVWETEFNGIIQLTQISKYDVDKRIISTKILDDTFDAQINNNKSLKAFVDVGTSKNEESITAVTPVDISLFLPTTGTGFNTYIATTREGFRVYDCFRFIIDYMTDGQVTFKSDLFAGDYYNWMLFNGKEVRVGDGNGDQLEVSFKTLYSELNKKCNVSFAIEPTPTGYTDSFQLRLEETSYFEQDDAVLTLENVAGILMDFNKGELYSDVNIGSNSFEDDVVFSYPPLNFKAFKKENYTIAGQCNIDKTLDLVSNYIIDTNIIEDILVNSVEKYDKNVFLIVTDGTKAIKYKEYDTPVSSGVTTGSISLALLDSTANFITEGVSIGDMVINMDSGNTATVTGIFSATLLIITADIFTTGNNYQVRTSPFNYNDPLTNVRVIERFTGGLPNSVIKYLSTASTANFEAAITTRVSDTVFPATIIPVNYDDDSTPPNFDTGGNFDAVTNFDYAVPSSGLYGFRAQGLFRLNGQMGAEEVSNGNFSGGATDWSTITSGLLGIFDFTASNCEVIIANNQTNSLFWIELRQPIGVLTVLGNYELKFDLDITDGGVTILGNTYTTSGSYTIQMIGINAWFNVSFKFTAGIQSGVTFPRTNLRIDNVSLKKTPEFNITQKIIRSTTAGVTLQEFSNTENYNFDSNEFQRDVTIITEQTFSTFSNEKITVDITIEEVSGTAMESTLLPERFNQNSSQSEYTNFKTVLVDDGGGDILPVDQNTFPIYRYKFEKALTFSEFKILRDSPEKAILFSNNNNLPIFAWRNNIDFDRKTGMTKFDLRSRTKINGECQ